MPKHREPRVTGASRLSAALYGVAHTLDFSGSLVRNRGRFSAGFDADAEALRGDWSRALNDTLSTDEPEERAATRSGG